MWDISIVLVGTIFFVLSEQDCTKKRLVLTKLGIVGLTKSSENIIDLSYDVLGLEALFLVPRICSLLSLNPYFGTLVSWISSMSGTDCCNLVLLSIAMGSAARPLCCGATVSVTLWPPFSFDLSLDCGRLTSCTDTLPERNGE